MVADLVHVAVEPSLLAAQQEQLQPARRCRVPGQRTPRRSPPPARSAAGASANRPCASASVARAVGEHPQLSGLPQLLRDSGHLGQLAGAAIGVAELPRGPERVLVPVEEPLACHRSGPRARRSRPRWPAAGERCAVRAARDSAAVSADAIVAGSPIRRAICDRLLHHALATRRATARGEAPRRGARAAGPAARCRRRPRPRARPRATGRAARRSAPPPTGTARRSRPRRGPASRAAPAERAMLRRTQERRLRRPVVPARGPGRRRAPAAARSALRGRRAARVAAPRAPSRTGAPPPRRRAARPRGRPPAAA